MSVVLLKVCVCLTLLFQILTTASTTPVEMEGPASME